MHKVPLVMGFESQEFEDDNMLRDCSDLSSGEVLECMLVRLFLGKVCCGRCGGETCQCSRHGTVSEVRKERKNVWG
jgi:hypothetical protein